MQILKFHSPVCENVSAGFAEMDVLSVGKSGNVYEFEVKISRSDFKVDLKKDKHKLMALNIGESTPNYFSYVCPKGMISVDEIPKYAGLYYVTDDMELIEQRTPKLIHSKKHDKVKILEKVCRITAERKYLGCARLTYENNLIREKYKQWEVEAEASQKRFNLK